ncbi:hypothetical protein EXE41_16365 [Halorubrum sp. SD690R]|uniref:hypothetical protein n=1 Tax=Halorubrum sp. SD690R TaxID=2518117 RepID=UPI0010F76B6C|nr:hypothetical protein [Halorubrum sp. SD690R]TKX42928.1 hypothetical protein EXE41_16365 [Halorubrum sp. SD690R]
MGADSEVDMTSVYENCAGDKLSFAQIAFASVKDPSVEVERVDDGDGYLFNGELYTALNRSDAE